MWEVGAKWDEGWGKGLEEWERGVGNGSDGVKGWVQGRCGCAWKCEGWGTVCEGWGWSVVSGGDGVKEWSAEEK